MIDSTVVLAQIDSALEDQRSLRLATAVQSLIECAAPAYNCSDPQCTCQTDPLSWMPDAVWHPNLDERLQRAHFAWRFLRYYVGCDDTADVAPTERRARLRESTGARPSPIGARTTFQHFDEAFS